MPYQKFKACIKYLLIIILFLASTCEAANSPHIQAVNVRMFLQQSGELSSLLTGNEMLWKVISGGGDVSEPTSAALVDVVVRGEGDMFVGTKAIELVVKSQRSGKNVARYRAQLGSFSPSGETHVGFWLPAIGCEPLIITASLSGKSKAVVLPFKCGE